MTVKCKSCNWEGAESSLIKVYDKGEMTTLDTCPECGDKWGLNDIMVGELRGKEAYEAIKKM